MAEEQEKILSVYWRKATKKRWAFYSVVIIGFFGSLSFRGGAALKTMREAGKRYFEDFKNSISCFLLSFLTIRLVGSATIHATYCR